MAAEKPLPHSLRIATEMGLDPSDPSFAIVKAAEMVQRQGLIELGILVSKLGDDIAATSVAAESAARAKAEQVITQAGEWAAGQILAAGHTAAAEIREALTSAAKPSAEAPWIPRRGLERTLGYIVAAVVLGLVWCVWWAWG